jgi:hypothetical protein
MLTLVSVFGLGPGVRLEEAVWVFVSAENKVPVRRPVDSVTTMSEDLEITTHKSNHVLDTRRNLLG